MKVEGLRLISKMLDGLEVVLQESGIPTIVHGDNWEIVGTTILTNRTYYDLGGYQLDDITLFAENLTVQEGQAPRGTTSGIIVDLVTTEPITDAEILTILGPGTATQFGFSTSTLNMQQIIYGRERLFVLNSTVEFGGVPIPSLHSVNLFGTGAATTGAKLYITRLVVIDGIATPPALDSWVVPQSNFVLGGMIAKETDMRYLARQKLSYEHANKQ